MPDAGKFPKIVHVVTLILLVAAVLLSITDAVPEFFSGFIYGLLLGLLIWQLYFYVSSRQAE